MCQTLSKPGQAWQESLESGAKRLKTKFPDQSTQIADMVKKLSQKSPAQEILKATAYHWLKFIKDYKPPRSFARNAVKIAHQAFRLNGKLATFEKYLNHSSRKSALAGLSSFTKNIACADPLDLYSVNHLLVNPLFHSPTLVLVPIFILTFPITLSQEPIFSLTAPLPYQYICFKIFAR